MKCPTCGTKLHEVVDTRKRGEQNYRRRECFNGHRFSTLETIVDMKANAPVVRKRGGKYPQELVNQCLAERDAGDAQKVIAARHGIPIDTLVGWLSRGERSPKQRSKTA